MRAYMRRRRLVLSIATVFVGLLLNVWVQDGTKPFLIVLAAVLGCVAVIASVGWTIGVQVVKHSRVEAAAIAAGTHPMKKELTR